MAPQLSLAGTDNARWNAVLIGRNVSIEVSVARAGFEHCFSEICTSQIGRH